MKRLATILSVSALVLSLSACGGSGSQTAPAQETNADSSDSAQPQDEKEVRVATWMQSSVEGNALDALLMVFDANGEGYRFVNIGSGTSGGGVGEEARKKIRDDMAAKNPPDTYQVHAGKEAVDDVKAGYLEPIDSLFEQFGLAKAFPSLLISELKINGKIYALPLNVHRVNMVWANPAVLKSAGVSLDPAPNLDAWLANMAQIKAAGKTPLVVGTGWTQAQLFEGVLIADLGAEGYRGLFNGTTSWDDPRIQQAINHFSQLLSYANPDSADLSWEDASRKLISGEGAYFMMGDWSLASFNGQGLQYGKDFLGYPMPGTAGIFDFVSDSFTKPVGAKNPEGSDLWLKVGTSIDGQVAFNKIKGSIPARSDIPAERLAEFSPYQQETMKAFAGDEIVSSYTHGVALPPAQLGTLMEIITKFSGGNSSPETFASELAAFGNKIAAQS